MKFYRDNEYTFETYGKEHIQRSEALGSLWMYGYSLHWDVWITTMRTPIKQEQKFVLPFQWEWISIANHT